MPFVGLLADTEPPAPPGGFADLNRVTATWTGGNGDTLTITDCSTGVDWLAGRQGVDMPPYELIEDEHGDLDGSMIRGVRARPRLTLLPVVVHLDTFGTWRELQQRLVRALDPKRGDGRLLVRQPDGRARVLATRYVTGAEGHDIADPRGLWYRIYPLQFRAQDPWWYAENPVTLTWTQADPKGFFDEPFFPLKLTTMQVLGEAIARNTGDVDAWPIWNIRGPASGLATLRSHRLDQEIVLNLDLDPGQEVTVNTREGTIVRDDGENLWSTRVGTPQLWPLLPADRDHPQGENRIQITVTGAGDGSRVRLTYTPGFLTS